MLVDPHVQALLGMAERATTRRLTRLGAQGLVWRGRIFDGQPAAVTITRRGLDAIGSPLPEPRIDFKGYRHDVGLGWLWLAAQQGAFGAGAVISERSMRSSDRSERDHQRPHGVGLGLRGPGGGEQLHYPDLLIAFASGRRLAVELELSAKSARRLDEIMLGYAGDGRLAGVLYLAADERIETGVEAAAARAGLSRLVRVQMLAAGSPAGAPPVPGRVRAGGRGVDGSHRAPRSGGVERG